MPAGTAFPPNVNGVEAESVVFSFAPARQTSPYGTELAPDLPLVHGGAVIRDFELGQPDGLADGRLRARIRQHELRLGGGGWGESEKNGDESDECGSDAFYGMPPSGQCSFLRW